MRDDWLIYSPGGGYGHCMRAMALARCAVAKQPDRNVTVVGNQSAIRKVRSFECYDRIRFVEIEDNVDRVAFMQQVRRELYSTPFQKIIVDTFPRGIVGELKSFLFRREARRVFVHRDVVPEFITSRTIMEAVKRFDLVLVPGEQAPLNHLESAVTTKPWVILDSNDLLTRNESRTILNCSTTTQPVCLISLSGKPNERLEFSRLACLLIERFEGVCEIRVAGDVPVEFESKLAKHHIDYWPLLKLLDGVDFLVGAGGYNTFHEAKLTSTKLFSLPQRRLYDRQEKRVAGSSYYSTMESLVESLGQSICNESTSLGLENRTRYVNGVHRAVKEIESI